MRDAHKSAHSCERAISKRVDGICGRGAFGSNFLLARGKGIGRRKIGSLGLSRFGDLPSILSPMRSNKKTRAFYEHRQLRKSYEIKTASLPKYEAYDT